jgi:hypothetical protein
MIIGALPEYFRFPPMFLTPTLRVVAAVWLILVVDPLSSKDFTKASGFTTLAMFVFNVLLPFADLLLSCDSNPENPLNLRELLLLTPVFSSMNK